MTSKIITSLIAGLLTPFLYFVLVDVGPIVQVDPGGGPSRVVGPGGLFGFVEFHGMKQSLLVWAKAAVICGLAAFFTCVLYDFIRKHENRRYNK